MKKAKLIAAVSVDGAIGHDNEMIWNVPEDLQHYKNMTMGNIVIIGHNTYKSMPSVAFKDRDYIVLLSEKSFKLWDPSNTKGPNVHVAYKNINIHNLLSDDKKIFVAGGSMIYENLFDQVDEAYITWINKMYPEANKRFPLDTLFEQFTLTEDSGWNTSKTGIGYKFTTYKRLNYGD